LENSVYRACRTRGATPLRTRRIFRADRIIISAMGKLDGKIALITGGSTGIGLATAKLFQEEGAQVILTGRNAEAIAAAQKELGPGAVAIASDTSKLTDIAALIDGIRQKFGRIDILFANAGVARFQPFGEIEESFFDEHFDINVKGLYFTVQAALPLIPSGGSILLTASVVSKKGFPGSSVYAATKAAVRSFGRTLATELAPKGIRVNTLSPGPVATPLFAKMGLPEDAIGAMQGKMAETVALKRLGTSEEIARAALFLSSDDASLIVGVELFADGGLAEL
jgi:NAD(P)-dependent dehydrogenase (short-subunit alcohol dehydrogenase family)